LAGSVGRARRAINPLDVEAAVEQPEDVVEVVAHVGDVGAQHVVFLDNRDCLEREVQPDDR